MTVIKKTVALHPIMDNYVRLLQSILIQKGHNATYSTALNSMILYQVMDISNRKMHPEVVKIINGFLNDDETISEISAEDACQEYMERVSKQLIERYVA
jgi:hypothetical protein